MDDTGGAPCLVTPTCSPSTRTAVGTGQPACLAPRAALAPAPLSHALLLGHLRAGWKQDQGPGLCNLLKSLPCSRSHNRAKLCWVEDQPWLQSPHAAFSSSFCTVQQLGQRQLRCSHVSEVQVSVV